MMLYTLKYMKINSFFKETVVAWCVTFFSGGWGVPKIFKRESFWNKSLLKIIQKSISWFYTKYCIIEVHHWMTSPLSLLERRSMI